MSKSIPTQPPKRGLRTIPRGADLTEADLRQIVDDFFEVIHWARSMRLKTLGQKEQLLQALEARLGRRPLVIEGEG